MSEVSVYEKMMCVERELRLREQQYPKWIERQFLSEGKAKYQLECLRAIVEDYRSEWRDGGNVIPEGIPDGYYLK